MRIKNWKDIKSGFDKATLILGNGFSIGIYDKFKYDSLWDEAKKEPACGETRKPLSDDLCSLADKLKTGTNFELLLRQLYTAKIVNKELGLDTEDKVEDNYTKIRTALIETIKEIHCGHSEVECELSKRIDFLKQFNTVFSLSYDLLVYWIINLNNRLGDGTLKDCFDKDCFDNTYFCYDDWEKYRKPYSNEKTRTLVFFPHGALHLVQIENGVVEKITNKDSDLLDEITKTWLNDSDKKHPLFVAEGTSDKKMFSIEKNAYLHTVYHQALPKSIKNGKLVIFGWAMSNLDVHLIEKIKSSKPTEIAIGIHHTVCNKEDECERINSQLTSLNLKKGAIKFFEIGENFFG